MAKSIVGAMDSLSVLLGEIFSCLLEPSYPSQLYYFERRLHKQKNKSLNEINHIEIVDAKNKCTHLFEVIQDIAQLRRRVTDHATFDIATNELRAILSALKSSFMQLQYKMLNKKSIPAEGESLSRAVDNFERIYFSVLNVAAPEPLVFLLFIDGLKTLSELLADCDVALEEWR